MNFNKVTDALRDAVKLTKLYCDSFEMESLVEDAETSLTAKGGFAYFLALSLGADNELMIVRSLEDARVKEKTLINPLEFCLNRFKKSKEMDIQDLFFRGRWPKDLLERYYESPEFSSERVQVLADVVDLWVEGKGKFPLTKTKRRGKMVIVEKQTNAGECVK
jgi:hypothetical protein